MPGRRRGARSGRGWDAAPSRARSTSDDGTPSERGTPARPRRRSAQPPLVSADEGEFEWPEGAVPAASAPEAEPRDPHDDDETPELSRGGGSRWGRGGRGWSRGSRSARAGSPGEDARGGSLTGGSRGGGGSPPGGSRGLRGGSARERDPRDEAERAREICLNQLAVRPRTRAELATALARHGISTEVAVEVLERYDEVGIIDDEAFARAWVSSRHHGRGLARRALARELRQRGVDADTAGAALDDLDPDTEAATARALVDRKLRTARGEPEAVFRRLVGMLARKGYGPGLAFRVVKEAMAAQSEEAAEFADGVDEDALADLEGDERAE